MAELKLSGNHLKGSRPVLSFDKVCLNSSHRSKPQCFQNCDCGSQTPAVMARLSRNAQQKCAVPMQTFDEAPHWQLLKEVLTHVFATPKRHHRSKPFFDHVTAFSVADGRVWLRNYQVERATENC